VANRYLKTVFNILSLKEMQIKTTLRVFLTPGRMAIIKKQTKQQKKPTTNAGEDGGGGTP
jgi:hypothetical protein